MDRSIISAGISDEFMEQAKRIVVKEPQSLIPAYAYPVIIEDRIYMKEVLPPSEDVGDALTGKLIRFVSDDVKGRSFEEFIKNILNTKKEGIKFVVKGSYIPLAKNLDAKTFDIFSKYAIKKKI